LGISDRCVPVGYLCLGYVTEFPAKPDLEVQGWEERVALARLIHFDKCGEQDEKRANDLLDDAG
jgi:5,6-dimethylbenzimidazole synthase